jgi:trigger factor
MDEMQANLERVSELERRLSVTLPVSDIATEVESRLKRLTRTVKMQGFRPGKVPLKVVARQYGPQVRQEVLGDAMQKSFGDAVREQNLRVAGYPRFEPKPLNEQSAEFQYIAVFEVYPEINVGDLSQTAINRPVFEVGEAEVDKTIEIMRKQRAVFDPADRPAQSGDRVTIDFRGTLDGVEFPGSSAKGHAVVLGENRMLPDFEAQVIGLKSGESRSFDLRFPDDYHGKEVAGKTAQFEVTVGEVAAPRLPEVDAEFAKALGVETGDIATMRAEVRQNLEREVKVRLKNRVKEQVMQALLASTRIEPPKVLVQLEIQRMEAAARQDLAQRGVRVKEGAALPVEMFEAPAQRRVSLGLILAELVKIHGLYARPEQVRALVEEQAQSYERPEEVIRWFYGAPERLRDIESAVMEENVVARVLSIARVQDQAVNFDELMGNK